jgi:gliding motility-associated-like protein
MFKMGPIYKPVFLIIAIIAVSVSVSLGQNEYLSTLNYNTLQVNQIGNTIPGVTWLMAENSTYDANHQRFFFQGNATSSPPWYLYTIDAVTGSVISSPLFPSNNTNGVMFGLQYDNKTDTLYALYSDRTGAIYFSWIEPSTGIVHVVSTLASFPGYYGSSFDTKDHYYICYSGSTLLAIDAASGNIVYNSVFPPGHLIYNVSFDNMNSKTYAICISSSLTYPQFDSVTLATGALHTIANLPAMSIPQIYANTLDEKLGKYVFVGSTPGAATCVDNTLYVVDITSGSVVHSFPYPYAENTSNPLDSNLLQFSFDNNRGLLYALHWRPTLATIPPLLNIAASSNPVCPNVPEIFTATSNSVLINNFYQWQKNGNNVGTNTSIYINNNPADGDTIRCILAASTICGGSIIDTSTSIILRVADTANASILITTSTASICGGQTIHFFANAINGGSSPMYQWQVNGVNVGQDSSSYSTNALSNGDAVSCLVTSNAACISNTPARSNIIRPSIMPIAPSSVSITSSNNNICSGDTVVFTATPVNGGNSPAYQWQVNGNNIGISESQFSSSSLSNGDTISCILSSSISCSLSVTSGSNIVMTVRPTPEIVMENDTTVTRGQKIPLTPSIKGSITNYLWTPISGLDNPTLPDPIASPVTSTTYQLKVIDADACAASGKTTIYIFDPLLMPNAFSPNGDGKNDIFRISPSIQITLFGFSIYNRWGQRVFFTTNSEEGWNGTIKGQLQSAGAYIWEIEYENLITKSKTLAKGTVILIR